VPLVSVVLATHEDARFLGEAIESVLTQTLTDLELIVVDDASTDGTPELLRTLDDDRVVVLRNEEQAGLAASLNRGLDRASGRYVARLDADDVAADERLQRQVAWMKAKPELGVVGSGVWDIDAEGLPGGRHLMPHGATALRWHALFSSPFFHPTVLVDREVLDRHGLRYDPSFLESEDYDLWARVLELADGDNLQDLLVFKRIHSGQASLRRAEIQESFQRQIALREIARVAPALPADEADLAWRLGSARGVPDHARREAGEALLALLGQFERRHGRDGDVRNAAARALGRARLLGEMRKVAPWLPAKLIAERLYVRGQGAPPPRRPPKRRARVRRPLKEGALRVTVVSPEPTPYRSPLFDRLAERPELDLTVIYAANTVADRPWSVQPRHRSAFLRGVSVPGARRLLRHDYPVTPAVARALRSSRPDVVVIAGWSTFTSQAAIAWSRAHRLPYVLHVESHDLEPRAGWRRAVKGAIVPRLLRGAASVLVAGSAARESVIARGASPERVRVFANTIDVPAWIRRAEELAAKRAEGRALVGLTDEDVVVLCVARLVPEKGLDTLARAVAVTGDERLFLRVAGHGPGRRALLDLLSDLGVRSQIEGDMAEEALAEEYVEADIFALLSRHEPWGVVVNEAAASGLPLVLSAPVGAAHDLLREGENGCLVPAEDVAAAAEALRRLAADGDLRRRMGARSRELVRAWGYEPSIEEFVAAVREAAAR
jgi:glycosyltransferase involved in cell wall biosynthesis